MTICLRRSVLAAALLCGLAPAAAHAQDDALATAIRSYEARDYASARDVLQRVTAAEPRNARAAFYLGRSLFALGDVGGAVRWLEKATQLAPDSARYHLLLADAVGTQAQRASILKQPGLARKAKGALERAVELDPRNIDAHWGLMQFYLIAPGILGGSDDRARAQAEIIAAIDPYFGEVARGTIADHTKKRAEAEQYFQRAIALRPDSVSAYNQLAALYRREPARPDMIVAVYEQLAERRPGVATPQYLLGLAFIEAARYDDARALFLRAAASHPDDTRFIYQIGRLGALTGTDLDRAEQNLRRYLTLTPEPGEPTHAAAHWRLGMIAEHRGDRTTARAEYEAALRLDPEMAQAKDALKRLKD